MTVLDFNYWIPCSGFFAEMGMEIVDREYRDGTLYYLIKGHRFYE